VLHFSPPIIFRQLQTGFGFHRLLPNLPRRQSADRTHWISRESYQRRIRYLCLRSGGSRSL